MAGASVAKLERLLNLTALLLSSSRPLSAEEVRDKLGQYPEDQAAFRRAFERDKDELRTMGIPVRVEPIPGTLPELQGYRIPPDEYALRDPGLTGEELAALHLAAAAVRVEGLPATEGLWKLGGVVGDGPRDTALQVAPIPADANLGVLFGAVAGRTPVLLRYRDVERRVDPHRLEFQRGRWYLSGHDHERGDARSYRLDRIEGRVRPIEGQHFDAPAVGGAGGVRPAWELGADDLVRARVRIEGPAVAWAMQHVGPDRVIEIEVGPGETAPAAIVVELPVVNRAAFRTFVLGFLHHAEVLEPAELRRDVIEWLEAI